MSTAVARRGSALVTGASSGVGRAISLALAPLVDELLLCGRDAARLGEVAELAQGHGTRAQCFTVDFADAQATEQLGLELGRGRNALSVLVHSAGVFMAGPMDSAPAGDFDRALDVNLRAPFLLTRALGPWLARGHADIVFINSSAVGQRKAGLTAYGASKHGLVGLADSLRQELNPAGVRVLSVFLGATATPMQEQIYASSGRSYQPDALLSPEHVATAVCNVIQLPRGAEVTDLHVRPAAPHR